MKLEVVYLDNHLLVVNKPSGMLVQGDRTGDLDLLTLGKDFVRDRFNKPGQVFLGLVHRLDRPVSGLVVFARTSKAASRLAEQFRSRSVDKRYVAVVHGNPPQGGTLVDHLVKEKEQVRVVSAGTKGALKAELEYRVLDRRDGLSLVDIRLGTGRPHQIRVQLASRGFPLYGDHRYGKPAFAEKHMLLHCYHLSIEHPSRHERMGWTAPPPSGWGRMFQNRITELVGSIEQEIDG